MSDTTALTKLTMAGAAAVAVAGAALLLRARTRLDKPPPLTRTLTLNAKSVVDWLPRLAAVFAKIDTSNDGVIELGELSTFIRAADDSGTVLATMAHLDVDSNGKVTFEEFTKYFLLVQTLVAPRRFREMLANMEAKAGVEPATTSASDSPPAVARQASRSEEMASVMVCAAKIFADVDANQDGTLSKDELVAKFGAGMADGAMAQMDQNKDGLVSVEEWNRFFIGQYNFKGLERVKKMLDNLESKL